MDNLPSGTVTFLFTDIEGSTKLSQQHPDAMPVLLARHHAILNQAVDAHDGYVFQIVGDSFAVAFHSASDALHAAVDAQQKLYQEEWTPAPIKVRMGIHTGEALVTVDKQYSGYTTLASTQRIMSAGHGGQILISGATRELVRDSLPGNTELIDLGEKRLKDLLRPEHLYQLNIAGLPVTFPPLKTLDLFPNNLPVQLTSFIGRENEIAELKQELETHRLVTLTGSGGTGKTRLSLQVATELLERFDHGVWFIELAPLADPDLIPQTILSTIGISAQQTKTPLEILKKYLHEKKTLIVLDNCEHLVTASAQVVNILLNAAPGLKILASSREALGVKGELSYPVPSLSLPDVKHLPTLEQLSQYESVRLFIDRALLVTPHFVVDKDNAPFIAQICYRLDGIPLAIELATARIKMLSVEQISKRLDDRFRLLTGGARTALPRQQTLRALIDWSYDILSHNERLLLQRLSVFAGGWTLEAAEEVCLGQNDILSYDVLDLLTQLVNKSLVVVMEGSQSGATRYRMLETIRQYAREKLAENGNSETVRNRHMDYFCQFIERIEPDLRGPNQIILLDGLERELDNLRAVLEWSLNHAVSSGLRLASGLKWFWHLKHHWLEGIGWLEQLLQAEEHAHSFQPDSKSDTYCKAKALLVFSHLTGSVGDLQRAARSLSESLALCEKMDETDCIPLKIESYMFLGIGALYDGDINQAKILAEKSLELSRGIGDKFGIAEVHYNLLTPIAFRSGEYETARILSESTLAIRQELGDIDGIVAELDNGGLVALAQGDYKRAQRLFRANIEASHDIHSLGFALGNLGISYLFDGEIVLAHEYFLQAAKFAQETWDPIYKVCSIYWLALYSFEQKQLQKFIKLHSFLENEKFHHMYLYYLPPFIPATFQKNVAAAREKLSRESCKSAEAKGKAMTLEQAFAYAVDGIND